MRFLFIFLLILLPMFAAAGTVNAQTEPTDETTTETTSDAKSDDPEEAASAATFDDRFVAQSKDPAAQTAANNAAFLAPTASPVAENACVPSQDFKAYGFYTLNSAADEVDFSVYTRVHYYSLIPGPAGNITVPVNWDEPNGNPTGRAHSHGAKVDLVISNGLWNISPDSQSAFHSDDALQFTKSYILLNMVDEIVEAAVTYEFDGVVIDFRLPEAPSPKDPAADDIEALYDAFEFFIKRLSDRLKASDIAANTNDLLEQEPRQVSLVIDSLADSYIKEILTKTSDSVDLLFVERDYYLTGIIEDRVVVTEALLEFLTDIGRVGSTVPVIPNPDDPATPVDETELQRTQAALWDVKAVADDDGNLLGWGTPLRDKVFGTGFNPEHTISSVICTERTTVLGVISGLTPFLVFLLLLSWVVYDFPKFINRFKTTLVLWVLLAVVVLAFLILLLVLPTLDLNHNGVYVIVSALVIPVAYIVWTSFSKFTEPDYP